MANTNTRRRRLSYGTYSYRGAIIRRDHVHHDLWWVEVGENWLQPWPSGYATLRAAQQHIDAVLETREARWR